MSGQAARDPKPPAHLTSAHGEIGKTIAWDVVERVLLVVHSYRHLDGGEWQRFIDGCLGLPLPPQSAVVVAPDVALSPLQRRQIGDLVAEMKMKRVAVVTDSRVARAMVTGIGWYTGVHKGFAPENIGDLIRFLGISSNETRQVLEVAEGYADWVDSPLMRGAALQVS